MNRRQFLKEVGRLLLLCPLAGIGLSSCFSGERDPGFPATEATPGGSAATPPITDPEDMEEAMFYESLSGQVVKCRLCFRECEIAEGERGFCRNRQNREGILYTLVYGKAASLMVEPVEKEPQHHFLPGKQVLCVGTASCNYRCKFCHNWHLSQRSVGELDLRRATAEEVVRRAEERNAPGISFTYNEPTVAYEYMYETARLAQENGLRFIFHSNGSMREEPLRKLLLHVDSVTIDLKAYNEEFYRELSAARLEPVLKTLEVIQDEGVWLEIVNLMIPTWNDNRKEIARMCAWIVENLGPEVPLHFSRFFPSYRLTDLAPTPVALLEEAHAIARREGLEYVSIGNVPGHRQNSTYCPECESVLIARHHFTVQKNNLSEGACPQCGRKVPGIWQ